MPRKRDLHPDFFHNEDLAKLHPLTRILFEGLWCWADREGRIEDRPARIKAEILPYDDHDVDLALRDLDLAGFIVRYEQRGVKCIWIRKFNQRQHPHPQERPSQLPRCKSDRRSVKQVKSNLQEGCEEPASNLEAGEKVSISKAGSSCDLDLAPSIQDLPEKQTPRPRKGRGPVSDYPPGFAEFWGAYPRKTGKGAALRAWRKETPDLPAVLAALAWQAASPDHLAREVKFIPHPATWLNQRRWEDEPPEPPPRPWEPDDDFQRGVEALP